MRTDIISRVRTLPHVTSVLITGGLGAGKTSLAMALVQNEDREKRADVYWQGTGGLPPAPSGCLVLPRTKPPAIPQHGTVVLYEHRPTVRVLTHAPLDTDAVVLDDLDLDFPSLKAVLARKTRVIVCTHGDSHTPAGRELEALFDVCLHIHVDHYTHRRKIATVKTNAGPLGSDSYELTEHGFSLRSAT